LQPLQLQGSQLILAGTLDGFKVRLHAPRMMVDAATWRQRGNRTPMRRATTPGRGAAAVSGAGGSGV
jgi:hypothetical protein